MTADDVRALLRTACEKAGGIRAWARERELSAPYVSDVLKGDREPGPSICAAFGLMAERETVYRKTKPARTKTERPKIEPARTRL